MYPGVGYVRFVNVVLYLLPPFKSLAWIAGIIILQK